MSNVTATYPPEIKYVRAEGLKKLRFSDWNDDMRV
jgi:hypothetical protein